MGLYSALQAAVTWFYSWDLFKVLILAVLLPDYLSRSSC